MGVNQITIGSPQPGQNEAPTSAGPVRQTALDGGAVGAAMGDRAIQAKPEAHPERPERKRGSPVHQAASFAAGTSGAPG